MKRSRGRTSARYECEGQMTFDDWITPSAKPVPIWKRYPGNCRGLCPKCGTEVYYDATYGERISDGNWNPIDGEYRGQKVCPKCKTEFDDDAHFPYGDYESYPTLSGIDDKPIPKVRKRSDLGQTFTTHGKRIMFEELADYYVKDIPVLVNNCTESQESYKLVKVEDVSRDRMTFSYGTNHRGYISRGNVNGNRGRINFECDACNEGGWVYSQDGEPETHPKGDRCLLDVDHICTKHCDSVIRQDCTEWKPKVCEFSGHECNKEQLWKVADSLDSTQCPHVCCRKCTTKECGARCNGVPEHRFRQWHRCSNTLPEKSGYYEIMDIDGTRGRAWFEKGIRDFDHVTNRKVEAWREEA